MAMLCLSEHGEDLRNRIIKTATFEGMTPGGMPSRVKQLCASGDGALLQPTPARIRPRRVRARHPMP